MGQALCTELCAREKLQQHYEDRRREEENPGHGRVKVKNVVHKSMNRYNEYFGRLKVQIDPESNKAFCESIGQEYKPNHISRVTSRYLLAPCNLKKRDIISVVYNNQSNTRKFKPEHVQSARDVLEKIKQECAGLSRSST